jgi:hypothetical protein
VKDLKAWCRWMRKVQYLPEDDDLLVKEVEDLISLEGTLRAQASRDASAIRDLKDKLVQVTLERDEAIKGMIECSRIQQEALLKCMTKDEEIRVLRAQLTEEQANREHDRAHWLAWMVYAGKLREALEKVSVLCECPDGRALEPTAAHEENCGMRRHQQALALKVPGEP